MKVLIDVNLAPAWTNALANHHIEAVHWTSLGDPRAADSELMGYARDHGYVVFTHDLDFGTLLALNRGRGPSVQQVRAQNVLPEAMGAMVARILTEHAAALESGALVTVDERATRVRVLPIV
jgi:predicted nuclease of predicted toxin-antitoxin system